MEFCIVPEGLNEGSLARSAWNCAKMIPSRRVRYDRSAVKSFSRQTTGIAQLTPFPTGRIVLADCPGTSCQATFILSLWDKILGRIDVG